MWRVAVCEEAAVVRMSRNSIQALEHGMSLPLLALSP
jgi:DNA-binding XRE family transcriptional regulator